MLLSTSTGRQTLLSIWMEGNDRNGLICRSLLQNTALGHSLISGKSEMLRSEQLWTVCFLKIETEIDVLLLYTQSDYELYSSHAVVRSEQKSNTRTPEIFSSKGASGVFSSRSYTCIKMFSLTFR